MILAILVGLIVYLLMGAFVLGLSWGALEEKADEDQGCTAILIVFLWPIGLAILSGGIVHRLLLRLGGSHE